MEKLTDLHFNMYTVVFFLVKTYWCMGQFLKTAVVPNLFSGVNINVVQAGQKCSANEIQ
jgi:hypothetical protein